MCVSTQEGGASHDGFGVLVSTTFPFVQNHKFAHDSPHPSWVDVKTHPTLTDGPRRESVQTRVTRTPLLTVVGDLGGHCVLSYCTLLDHIRFYYVIVYSTLFYPIMIYYDIL